MSEADPGLTPQTGPNIQNQDPTLTPEAANHGRINPLEIAATGIGKLVRSYREAQLHNLEQGPSKIAQAIGAVEHDPKAPTTGAEARKLTRKAIHDYNSGQTYGAFDFTRHDPEEGIIGGTLRRTGGDSYRVPEPLTRADKDAAKKREEAIGYGELSLNAPQKPGLVSEYTKAQDDIRKSGAALPKGKLYSPNRIFNKYSRQRDKIMGKQGLQIANTTKGKPATSTEAEALQGRLHAKLSPNKPDRKIAPLHGSYTDLPDGIKEPVVSKKKATQNLKKWGPIVADLAALQQTEAAAKAKVKESNEPIRYQSDIETRMSRLRSEQFATYGKFDDISVFETLAEDILGKVPSNYEEQLRTNELIHWYSTHITRLMANNRTSYGVNGNTERLPRQGQSITESKVVDTLDQQSVRALKQEIKAYADSVVAAFGDLPNGVEDYIRAAATKQVRMHYLLTNPKSHTRSNPDSEKPFAYNPQELESDQKRLQELLDTL